MKRLGFRSEECRTSSIPILRKWNLRDAAGCLLQGRAAMAKEFGPEAQQAVNGTTQAAFSNYRVRFIKPDVAVIDALLTVHNANGPDGTIIPAIPVIFFYVAVRHADRWLIQDGRTHFAAAPPSNMTKSG